MSIRDPSIPCPASSRPQDWASAVVAVVFAACGLAFAGHWRLARAARSGIDNIDLRHGDAGTLPFATRASTPPT